jgi:hypothetical protein
MTVDRSLLAMKLRAYCPFWMLPLPFNACQKAHRFEWCQARLEWDLEWNSICFSDESKFCFGGRDGRKRIRRCRDERQNIDCSLEHHIVYTEYTESPQIILNQLITYIFKKPSIVTSHFMTN